MAAPPRLAATRAAGARARDTGRRRADREEAARGARAADDPGRARVPAAPLRARGTRARDLRPVRRGRGGDRRRGAERPRPARPPAPAREGSRRRRVRRDHRRLVQPGLAQRQAPARHAGPLAREPEGQRVHGPFLRRERRRGDCRLRARLPRERGDHRQEAARRGREGARLRRRRASIRCPPLSRRARGSPAAPTRSSRFIVPRARSRASRRGSGLPSTSCSRSRSGSRGEGRDGTRSGRRRSASPASSWRATAASSRSS